MNAARKMIMIAALGLLAGCQETPQQTRDDVAAARTEAAKDSANARREADETRTEASREVSEAQRDYTDSNAAARESLTAAEAAAMRDKAETDYVVAIADAEGRHDIEREKCDALVGAERDTCVTEAGTRLANDRGAALWNRDTALAAAGRPN